MQQSIAGVNETNKG